MVVEGILRRIPGTTPYAQKYFVKYLQKLQSGHDVVLEVTWEDGVVSYEAADHNREIGAYVTDDGHPFFIRGEFDGPDHVAGVPLVRVDASIAAPIDRKAALAAGRDEMGEYVRVREDGSILEEDAGAAAEGGGGGQEAVADGGEVGVKDRLFDMSPGDDVEIEPAPEKYIDKNDGFAGETYSLRAAAQRVPNPISPREVKEAIDWARQSEMDQKQVLTYIAISFGAGLAVPIMLYLLVWFLGQLGGGGGAGITLPAVIVPLLGALL